MPWTTPALVAEALGPSIDVTGDPWLARCCDAASTAAFRKRREAGYTDDPDIAPDAAVENGTTQWALALWRSRASTDTYASFDDLAGFQPTGGTWADIRRMLGIGRAAVDRPPVEPTVAPLWWRHRLIGR